MKGVFQVEMKKMIPLFMEYCMSRQLRPKTMLSYEQACRLFALWLEESEGVKHVEEIKDMHIRRYIIELRTRGKSKTAVDTETDTGRNHPVCHPTAYVAGMFLGIKITPHLLFSIPYCLTNGEQFNCSLLF